MVDLVQWFFSGVETFVTQILPWILVAAIILAIGYIVSKAVQAITMRIMIRFRIEEALMRAGVGGMVRSVGFGSVSQFFGTLVFWFLFLMFVLLAFSLAPTQTALGNVLQDVAVYIPRIIAAAFIVVAGVWAGTWLAERVRQPSFESEVPFPPQMMAGALKFIAIAISAIIALNLLLGPENVVILTWTALAAIVALFLGLGASLAYGARHLSANLAGYMQSSQSLRVGDEVEIGEFKGTVQAIHRYAVVLKDGREREVIVPNSRITQEVIVRTGSTPAVPPSKDA